MDGLEQNAFEGIGTVKEMIGRGDHVGATEKLLKLKCQFPGLVEIHRMITVCDILHSASFDFLGGVTDWYLVLEVPQTASEQDVESQYEKFCDLLKPIRNHFPAAESALQIVEEAYSVLSNPEKRSSFNKKRTKLFETCEAMNFQQIHGIESKHGYLVGESIVQIHEMSLTSTKSATAAYKTTNGIKNVGSSKDSMLFIDSNSSVNLNEEAIHSYIHHEEGENFSVQQACGISQGVEREINYAASRSSNGFLSLKGHDQEQFIFNNIKTAEHFEVNQIWAAYDQECMPRNYVHIGHIEENPLRLHVQCLRPAPLSSYEAFWCGMGLPVVCGLFNVDISESIMVLPPMLSHMVCSHASDQVEIHPKEHEIWAMYSEWDPITWCSSDPEARKNFKLELVEIVTGYKKSGNMLVARLVKAKGFKNAFRRHTKNGHEQLIAIPSHNLFKFSHSIPARRFVEGDMDGMFELDPYAVPSSLDCPFSASRTAPDSGSKLFESENKWSLQDFACNQIWAARDGPDAMPRRYVLVNNVAPEGEICVTFLEPNPMLADEIHWLEQDLPLAFGTFEAGKNTTNLGVSQFSHLVKCERSQEDSSYRIYPKKGEIWAMYKNWNCQWKQSDITCCQYQIVEIVADFTDDSEILVASLAKVPGYTTFFQRKLYYGYELIPRAGFISFSHQIVACSVQGAEDNGISKASWHIQPDRLPHYFLTNPLNPEELANLILLD